MSAAPAAARAPVAASRARAPLRLDLYVVGEILPMFAGGLAVVVVLLVLASLFELAAPIIAKGADPLLVMQYLGFRMPEAFARSMPLALLFAVLLSLGRLSQDSELKAAIVGGVSPGRLALPVLLVGGIVAALAFANAEALVPRGNAQALRVSKDIILANPRVLVEEGQFFKDGQGQAIYVREIQPGGVVLGVTVMQTATGQIPRSLTRAPRGRIDAAAGAIVLQEGTRYTYRADDPRPVTVARFRTASIPIRDLQEGADIAEKPIQLSLPVLTQRIADLRRQGLPVAAEETALQRKFAEPFAAVAFALFGVAMALYTLRSNQSLGFVGVMFLTFFYYATWSVFRVMGEQGALWPPLAAWGPDLVYAGAGLALLLLARNR